MTVHTHNSTTGFDLKAITWVRDEVRGLRVTERAVLQYLATRCDRRHQCYPSQAVIAADLELSRRTVVRTIGALVGRGHVTITRRPNRSAVYVLAVPGVTSVHPGSDTVVTPGSDTGVTQKKPLVSSQKTEKIDAVDLHQQCLPVGEEPSTIGGTGEEGTDVGEVLPAVTKTIFPEETKKSFPEVQACDCDTPYLWTERDTAVAMVGAWFGYCAESATGRQLAGLGDRARLLLKVNQLVRDYAPNFQSPKARTAFWYSLGRLIYPKARIYQSGHKQTYLMTKALNEVCDKLGPRAPYVLAHVFLTWDPKLRTRPHPQMGIIEVELTPLEAAWESAYEAIPLPLVRGAYRLLAELYGLDTGELIDTFEQRARKLEAEQTAILLAKAA